MPNLDAFWAAIEQQLEALKTAKTADEVFAICPRVTNLSAGGAEGFFGGSGGDEQVEDSLVVAGWDFAWRDATYYWAMTPPDGGDGITYVEGDLYRGVQNPMR